MNMRDHHWILTLLCGALFATSSLAAAQAAEAPPWYEIEIIIFTRDIQPASLNEAWPANPGTPDFDHARPLQRDPADEGGIDDLNSDVNLNLLTAPSAVADENSTLTESNKSVEDLPPPETTTPDPSKLPLPIEQLPKPYTLLLEEDFKLKTEFNRLQRSSRLKPEIHLAWRQPVTDKNSAQLLYLRTPFTTTAAKIEAHIAAEAAAGTGTFAGFETTTEADPPSLEGTIRISVKRYLHVELDLLRHIPAPPSFVSYEQSFDDTLSEEQPQTTGSYRMQAHRRMRSNELHYIDHPLMGALIKITPYEIPKPIPVESEEAEAVEPPSQTGEIAIEEAGKTAPTAISQQPDTTRSSIEIPIKAAE